MGQLPQREVERAGTTEHVPLKQGAFERSVLTAASSGLRRSICTERPVRPLVLYEQKLCRSEPVNGQVLGYPGSSRGLSLLDPAVIPSSRS